MEESVNPILREIGHQHDGEKLRDRRLRATRLDRWLRAQAKSTVAGASVRASTPAPAGARQGSRARPSPSRGERSRGESGTIFSSGTKTAESITTLRRNQSSPR